ncbi:DUF2894 domain-containing protein [Ideonella sp. DXS29W]|uniref:DUF2894 domain-containing protein n=1 Tax=Ideonella lacteola TaxID=2984193 RepID=A0ABU9BSB9_9BURK
MTDTAGSPADLEATLADWRLRGADQRDPVRFRFIEAMAQRAAAQQGPVRRMLDARLASLMQAYEADAGRASPAPEGAEPDASESPATAEPLAEARAEPQPLAEHVPEDAAAPTTQATGQPAAETAPEPKAQPPIAPAHPKTTRRAPPSKSRAAETAGHAPATPTRMGTASPLTPTLPTLPARPASPGATSGKAGEAGALGDLLAHLAQRQMPLAPPHRPGAPAAPGMHSTPAARGTAPLAASAPPELKALQYFRSTWSRLSTEQRLAQSAAKLPENAGPLNSQHLVHQSLVLMRELSPGYLERFIAHVDALLWLDQVTHSAGPR